MNNEDAKILEYYPHLTRNELDRFGAETKVRLLEQYEIAKATPPPKIQPSKIAPPVKSLLLAHRIAAGGSLLSTRGQLLPGDPVELADIGGGIVAWRSLVARGLIALHPELADPGDGGEDGD